MNITYEMKKTKLNIKSGSRAKRKINLREQAVAYLFLLPALALCCLTKYYPILQGFFVSFFEVDIVNLPGRFVGFSNYIHVFNDPQFYAALTHNIYFLLTFLVMAFWAPILLAMLLNEVRHKKSFFRMMYFLPALVPGIALSVVWKYIWQPDYGLANYILSLINLPSQMWLNDINLTYWCMAFPWMLMSGGMNMLIYLAAMQDISKEHYEAAVIEGASFFQRVRMIMLPQIKNIIIIMFILEVIAK